MELYKDDKNKKEGIVVFIDKPDFLELANQLRMLDSNIVNMRGFDLMERKVLHENMRKFLTAWIWAFRRLQSNDYENGK